MSSEKIFNYWPANLLVQYPINVQADSTSGCVETANYEDGLPYMRLRDKDAFTQKTGAEHGFLKEGPLGRFVGMLPDPPGTI